LTEFLLIIYGKLLKEKERWVWNTKKNGCTKIGEIEDMNSTFNQLLSMKNLRDVQKTEILVQMEQASKNKDKETLLRLTKQLRSIS
jgi:hypothetical protein